MLNRLRAYSALARRALRPAPHDYPRGDVLIACGDADRAYSFHGRRYAQLGDSLGDLLCSAGVSVVGTTLPPSTLRAADVHGHVANCDASIARAELADTALKVVTLGRGGFRPRTVSAWSNVLRSTAAKAVVAVQPPAELCMAARRLGIWVADLQHGIISGDPYYEPTRTARAGRDAWPDAFLVWDSASARAVEAKLGESANCRVIGNPWFARFAFPGTDDEIVQTALRALPPEANDAKPAVLVTMQWGLESRAGYHPLGLPADLVSLMTSRQLDVRWWLRVHPLMMQPPRRDAFLAMLGETFAGHSEISWRWCSEAPLPLLLARASAHITSHSAAAIEAAWFGVHSALYDTRVEALSGYFAHQLAAGLAEIVPPDAPSIARWLTRTLEHRGHLSADAKISPQALSTFVDDMREYVSGRRPRPER